MQKLIPALICAVGLAVACHGFGGDAPKVEERKEGPQKPSDNELKLFKQMIKDLGNPNFAIREQAFKQLLKTPRAVPDLRRELTAPGLSPEAKRRVENLLGELDVEKLLEKLEGEQERIDATYGTLTKFGLNHGTELLRIYKSADEKTKTKLAVVFGKVRAAAIEAKSDDQAGRMEDALLSCLREPNDKVVYPATWALTNVGPPSKKAIPIFIEILKKEDSSWNIRSAAAWGLTYFGTSASEAIPVLLKCLNAKVENRLMLDSEKKAEADGRASICGALVSVGPKDDRVFDVLKKVVLDRNEPKRVRTEAILGIASLGDRGEVIIPELMGVLKDTRGARKYDDYSLRSSTLTALGKLKLSRENIPTLVEIATDSKEEPELQAKAVIALIHSHEVAQAAWRPLFRSLQDHESGPPVREIVVALREIAPPPDADRSALAREVRKAFDVSLEWRTREGLRKEMDKTVKAIEKNKKS